MAAAFTAAFGMAQHAADTSIESTVSESHFNTLAAISQSITTESLHRRAGLYMEESALERKLAGALRRQAHEIARRECLRDTWVAHTGNVQTSLFVATVLIGFGYEILSGAIVSEAWLRDFRGAVSAFFVLTLLSIGLGLVALSLLVVRYQRLAQFDFETTWRVYSCGHSHSEMAAYIECRCRMLEKSADVSLIVSACCGLCALMFYSVDKFQNLPTLGNVVASRVQKNNNIQITNNNNTSSSSPTSYVVANSVRDVGAPFIFCVIVGATMIVMLVMEFVLSSDTLKRLPKRDHNEGDDDEDDEDSGDPKLNKNTKNHTDPGKDEQHEQDDDDDDRERVAQTQKQGKSPEKIIEDRQIIQNLQRGLDLIHHRKFPQENEDREESEHHDDDEFRGELPELITPENKEDDDDERERIAKNSGLNEDVRVVGVATMSKNEKHKMKRTAAELDF